MNRSNDFVNNSNKGMLWGLLQESNIFDGIENEKFTKIQEIFEDTIRSIHINNTKLSLLEKNKLTVETLISKINEDKKKTPKTIQVIYKAEDLQTKRTEEFNIKLKQQQDSMNSMMNVSKPKEVSFSDETDGDDKPIGDEMDRLIAERLASRERELEIPSMTKETEEWLNNSNNSKNSVEVKYEKKVSFNKFTENNTTNTLYNSNISDIDNTKQNSIFNKLKRKTNEIQTNIPDTIIIPDTITIPDTIHTDQERITNIEYEIKSIKENQEKILTVCSKILSILDENKE